MKPDSSFSTRWLWMFVAFALAPFAGAAPSRTVVGTELVEGVPCSGKIEFYDGGRLKRATLSRDHEIAGNALPSGTRVDVLCGQPGQKYGSRPCTGA